MTFADIPAGASLFLDANTFVYHFQPHATFGAACTNLLKRIELRQMSGFASSHVLAEVVHRLMTLEACATYGWPFSGIARRMKKHPAEVAKLVKYRQAIQEVSRHGVTVLPIVVDLIDAATAITQQTGLLLNDAVTVSVMQSHGLTHLASHDADFDRVPGIIRYSPV